MKKFFVVFAMLMILISKSSVAFDGCTNPHGSYDATYCSAKLFIASDQELNDVYIKLAHAVPLDVKKQLIQAQREWINYRDTHCSDDGTIIVDCNFEVNKERIAYLTDRLRECNVGHCQNKLIVAKSFYN